MSKCAVCYNSSDWPNGLPHMRTTPAANENNNKVECCFTTCSTLQNNLISHVIRSNPNLKCPINIYFESSTLKIINMPTAVENIPRTQIATLENGLKNLRHSKVTLSRHHMVKWFLNIHK